MQMSLKWGNELVNIKPINLYYLVENINNELQILLINYFNIKIRI
jgi:hypothetical protein